MKGLVSEFVLCIFLMILMWTGVSYSAQNMQYSSARDFYHVIVRRMENHDFDPAVIQECKDRAGERGYKLQIKQYNGNKRDARITLEFICRYPMTQQMKQYKIDGYAR